MRKSMKQFLFTAFLVLALSGAAFAAPDEAEISEATAECLGCHEVLHPGIVEGWKNSRHAVATPAQALKKDELSRRVSADHIPEPLAQTSVGCAECHGLRSGEHKDTFEHNGYEVHMAVSPADCAVCHTVEARQYSQNVMAHAYGNLAENKLYQKMEMAINGPAELAGDGKLAFGKASDQTGASSCYHCHGTKLKVSGTTTRDSDFGEMEFPVISGWPNNGVGRVNLDGSLGSCAACHTRHEFSIETARKPDTCKECHNGPDVPAYKVYSASKHGNLYSAQGGRWNFDAVPWTVGRDFTAPTCATCHVSLITDTDGEIVAKRSHKMADRLPWRIFGLVYAHPSPKDPRTYLITNSDGLQLPVTLDGKAAEDFLIDAQEMDARRESMQGICRKCHGTAWVDGHWARFENTIEKTDASVKTATALMLQAWKNGLATGWPENPFDEPLERAWSDTWLLYANNVRFTSAMAGGGDYGVFADGRYWLKKRLSELHEKIRKKTAAQAQ